MVRSQTISQVTKIIAEVGDPRAKGLVLAALTAWLCQPGRGHHDGTAGACPSVSPRITGTGMASSGSGAMERGADASSRRVGSSFATDLAPDAGPPFGGGLPVLFGCQIPHPAGMHGGAIAL